MPKPISTFCTASRSCLAVKSKAQYIWVSEDVLSETYTTFVRNHKRFGSNVPGPLEARKRAAKRRATQLAHQSATNYNPESFGLFDAQPQEGWWQQNHARRVEPQTTSWNWHFLLPQVAARPPPPPEPSKYQHHVGMTETEYVELAREKAQTLLVKHLHNIHTHLALMDMLASQSISIRNTPQLATIIIGHMLAQSWGFTEVAEHLLDPRSNPPGTMNHLSVVQYAQENPNLLSWLLRQNVFPDAVRLGLLDMKEIEEILLLASRLDPSFFPGTLTWASFSTQTIDAMNESGVLGPGNFTKGFILRWLEEISRSSFCPAVPGLLWRLHELFGSGHQKALGSVVYAYISMVKEDAIHHLHELVDFMLSQPHEHVRHVIFSLTYRLVKEAGNKPSELVATTWLEQSVDWSFRRDLMRRARGSHLGSDVPTGEDVEEHNIGLTTSKLRHIKDEAQAAKQEFKAPALLELRQQRLAAATKLELWYAVLGNLGFGANKQFQMDKISLRNFLGRPVDESNPQQQALAALWVVMALSIRDDASIRSSAVSDIIASELRQTFLLVTETQKQKDDMLANLCRALHQSPLPAKNKLFRRLYVLSGKTVDIKQGYWTLGQYLSGLDGARILELRNKHTYRDVKQHFPAKLTELAECFNTDMSRFESTGTDIIRYSSSSMSIVRRMLTHNEALKRALKSAGKKIRAASGGLDIHPTGQQPALGGYTYMDLVNMIHNFADEISRSQVQTPRGALRQLVWMKAYLVGCSVPLQPRLHRAFWHAAVVRQDREGNGSCYTNVRWLYEKIKEAEGEDVARGLLAAGSSNRYELEGHRTMDVSDNSRAGQLLSDNEGQASQPRETPSAIHDESDTEGSAARLNPTSNVATIEMETQYSPFSSLNSNGDTTKSTNFIKSIQTTRSVSSAWKPKRGGPPQSGLDFLESRLVR